MKQIKTIADKLTQRFDDSVNGAIAGGWTLIRRYYTPDYYFVAEMEKEIYTEEEKCCENCAHQDLPPGEPPCLNCSENCDMWVPEL